MEKIQTSAGEMRKKPMLSQNTIRVARWALDIGDDSELIEINFKVMSSTTRSTSPHFTFRGYPLNGSFNLLYFKALLHILYFGNPAAVKSRPRC